MESQVWSQISLEHAPNWFEEMLISLGAIVVKDSDSLMWHHRNDRTHHEMRYSNNKDLYLATYDTCVKGKTRTKMDTCNAFEVFNLVKLAIYFHRPFWGENADNGCRNLMVNQCHFFADSCE